MIVWHMSGAGNTFLVVDARGQDWNFSALARRLCALRSADGFMALTEDPIADFRLNFYNSDGSRAVMCGNGARCICRFAYENRIAGEQMILQTDGGPIFGQRKRADWYRVRLNDPSEVTLGPVSYVEYGVPHAVVELPELEYFMADALRSQATELRQELDANVNYFRITGPNQAMVLTYERGVEDFTAACGTGCAAVASVLHARRLLRGTLKAETQGGELLLDITPGGTYLTGPAEILEILEIRE